MNSLLFILCAVYFLLDGYRLCRSPPWHRALLNKGAKMRALTGAISHSAAVTRGGAPRVPAPADVQHAKGADSRLCPLLRLAPWAPLHTHAKSQTTAGWLALLWQIVVSPAVALSVLASDVLPAGDVRVGAVFCIALPALSCGTTLPLHLLWRGACVWV